MVLSLVIIILAIIIFVLLLYMWIEAHKNSITHYELHYASLPNQFSGMRIFFISDIHRRTINETLIKKINAKVDLVIIGGDLAEKGIKHATIEKNLKLLTSVAPTYFVWGNNDYEIPNLEKLLTKYNVKMLVNESKVIERGDNRIWLIGVDDLGHGRANLSTALENVINGTFRILISHNPQMINKLTGQEQIKLIISGHTHGGQIRLFGFGIRKKGGIYKLDEQCYLLISNGYGTTKFPLRLGAPAEANIITLINE